MRHDSYVDALLNAARHRDRDSVRDYIACVFSADTEQMVISIL